MARPSLLKRMPERNNSAFWSYEDLALLLSAILPCYVGAATLLRFSGATTRGGQTLVFQSSLYALLLTALYLLVSWRYHKPFWQSLGWTRRAPGAWWCVVGGPLLAISGAVLAAALRAPDPPDPVKELITGRAALIIVVLFGVVLGPIFEELFFRGFLFPLLAKTFGAAAGIILSALPFALLHGPQYQWAWQQLAVVGLSGVAFGFVRYRTGSTAASTILHSCYNLTQFVAFLALRRY
jgi:membrane protease YdiL (CAAX protease family)